MLASTQKLQNYDVLQLLAVAQHHSTPHPGAPIQHKDNNRNIDINNILFTAASEEKKISQKWLPA